MTSCPVELRVGGQIYRVVSTAAPDELQRLADLVDERLHSLVPPGRQPPANALVLVALSLAHDLEQERESRLQLQQRTGQLLRSLVDRIDEVLTPSVQVARTATVSPRSATHAHNSLETTD